MTEPHPGGVYQVQYDAAGDFFDAAYMNRCIEEAKKNLQNKDLPPWYVIRNCVLIACALDDWYDANIWRLSAEQEYSTTLAKARRTNDEEALEGLKLLREELDQLKRFKDEDDAAEIRYLYRDYGAVDAEGADSGMDGDEDEDEDEEMLEAEDCVEDEVEAKPIVLTFRPRSI